MTPPPGRSAPDLLISGDDRPPRRLSARGRRTAAGAGVVLVAAAAAALVVREVRTDRAEDERRRQASADAAVVQLVLRSPDRDGPRYGPSRAGLDVVVVNTGPATVRLLSGSLVPGGWQVQVPAERDVRPGRSAVLTLTPPLACGAPEPRLLQVQVLPASGHPATAEFPVARTPLADGGRLDEAVEAAVLGCDPIAPPTDDGRTYPHRS